VVHAGGFGQVTAQAYNPLVILGSLYETLTKAIPCRHPLDILVEE
jgi:hypothetical protein